MPRECGRNGLMRCSNTEIGDYCASQTHLAGGGLI